MIEAGEYVRTKKGLIRKVKTIYGEEDRIKRNNFSIKKETLINGAVKIPDIVNHSKNIIDLIEVGDYVNGEMIREPIYNGNTCQGIDEGYELFRRAFGDIKTILTKEQFASMEYKVKEE